jgi:hypothetical protein
MLIVSAAPPPVRGSGSVVEHHLAKVRVAGSNPVFRSRVSRRVREGPFVSSGARPGRVRGRFTSRPGTRPSPARGDGRGLAGSAVPWRP